MIIKKGRTDEVLLLGWSCVLLVCSGIREAWTLYLTRYEHSIWKGGMDSQ